MTDPDNSNQHGDRPITRMQDLERIFARVSEVPREQQDDLLQELCPDESVQQQVRSLLDADAVGDPLLDHSLVPELSQVDAGEVIAGYTLVRQLGLGGMGVVFEAQQFEPVRRSVALKVIKPGVDTREVIARFDVERQALSLMDHPNIAKVLDAGSTGSGRPFFVMELVKGRPITTYCEQNQLSIAARLELFLTVCYAIQHAHQKGIIHRDIKPSNVLVAEYDRTPVAKVIDFGVAKAVDQSVHEMPSYTQVGQIVGTFEYMSPEQSRIHQIDVDTRTDIYSLGVLLYELLVGAPPFDNEQLRSVEVDEMLRIIRDQDPPRPSTRVADHQSGRSPALTVPGELDWIVMKSMEKERTLRYSTPNELAEDIERFLNGEAVAACPPSLTYRLTKFAKRNRVAFITSAVVGVSLVVGLISTTWYAVRASRAEAEMKEMNDFLKDRLFDLAGSEATGGFSSDPNLGMLIVLKNASSELDKRFPDQSEIRAELKASLARKFRSIGAHEDATQLYTDYWEYLKVKEGPDDPDAIAVMSLLIENYIDAAKLVDAKRLCEEALSDGSKLGKDHELTLQLQSHLATIYRMQGLHLDALAIQQDCLMRKRRLLGDDHYDTLATKSQLALVREALGEFEMAEKLHQEVLAIYVEKSTSAKDIRLVLARRNLGRCFLQRGMSLIDHRQALGGLREDSFSKASSLLCDSWTLHREIRGHYDPATLDLQFELIRAYLELARFDAAEPLLVDLVTRLERLADSRKAAVVNMLGWLYLQQARFDEAERTLNNAAQMLSNARPDEPLRLKVLENLAIVLNRMGKLNTALELDLKTAQLAGRVLGHDHRRTLAAKARLGMGYLETDRIREGRELLGEVFRLGEALPGAYQIAGVLADSYATEDAQESLAWTAKQMKSARAQLEPSSLEFASVLDRCMANERPTKELSTIKDPTKKFQWLLAAINRRRASYSLPQMDNAVSD